MSEPRYHVVDRFEHTANHMRPRSTMTNPRYLVWDRVAKTYVDEFTTKAPAAQAARDLNDENK